MISSMESHCLPFSEIPHTTKLFSTFLEDFGRVSRYYAHPPTDHGIFAAAREVKLDPETRREAVAALREQNRHLGADGEAQRNLDRLAAGAVAIVTGQQVGLFSGPIYSFFKALCAVRFAEEITKRGVDAVPIFWLATEDHDLAEVSHTFWNTRAGLARYELPPREETLNRRVGEIAFGDAISPILDQATETLEGPYAAEVARFLRESYAPAETYGSAYGKLMARLLAGRGIIFIDPLDARLHRIAAPVYRRALDEADSLRDALDARSKELERSGFHAQVKVAPGSTLLFYNVNGQRQPLRSRNGKFFAGDAEFTLDQLRAATEADSMAFSPSVLLRPIVQDTLLPTAAYIGGPSEVAYMAQAQVVYEKFLGRMPAILPRSSFTLTEPSIARLLSKYALDFQDVLLGPQHVRSKMEQKALPDALASRFDADEKQLRAMLRSYAEPIEKLDKSLLGTLDAIEEKILYVFLKLKEKVGRAENFRTGVLDEHQRMLFDSLYPNRELQERSLCGLPFIAAYGLELFDTLARLSVIPSAGEAGSCTHQHQILSL
jgi:bacillithiol biosynthesis cysteine-adding enzyme BshC